MKLSNSNRATKVNYQYLYLLSLLSALTLSLYLFEVFLPRPVPFLRIGLSNIIVLSLVYSKLYKEGLIICFVKSIIGNFILGLLFSVNFILSLVGSLLAWFMMFLFHRVVGRFSLLGISIIGAYAHLMGQLIMVKILFIKSGAVYSLYPLIVLLSIVFGIITGLLSIYFLKIINLRSYFAKALS